ncbi:MAG TPA: pyrimidine dimer DNA glycosylase/endonuclease V [Candidatus Microbacterium stercoravium]|uniref:Pyrimidine dimer DNA glycosylase/endonuclease V n=1 Tax=Candidatus Microbacterium stercoravium TaxID=2838697 RepID=A0A9D2KGD8_9MICO|nr:pyrimidine dimer DNA glycosylase/endonuclease V [Candidatus Microbacterium stercoravium]
MRLWSMHPRYFDRQALTACWREGLLAQSVLAKPGGGYSHHPQLRRFQQAEDPRAAIGDYLHAIVDEADARGYRFSRDKIRVAGSGEHLLVNDRQLAYEWQRLLAKLQRRSHDTWERWHALDRPDPHPMFVVVDGPIAEWEKVPSLSARHHVDE